MDQIAQIAGAVLILLAFIAAQRGSMSPHSLVYLVLNLAGSLVLTVVAAVEFDLGFLLLEAVWALVSAWGLWQLSRGQRPSPAH
jgi:hypothetical protein